MTRDEVVCWLSFCRFRGISCTVKARLIDYFDGAPGVYASNAFELRELLGPSGGLTEQLVASCDQSIIASDLKWLAQTECHLLPISSKNYLPLVVYVQGDSSLLAFPQIAIVGSRNPTQGGVQNSRIFANALAQGGMTITSGLALGIDSAAHRGALELNGNTIAWLARDWIKSIRGEIKNWRRRCPNTALWFRSSLLILHQFLVIFPVAIA